jgi:hypothetical protein
LYVLPGFLFSRPDNFAIDIGGASPRLDQLFYGHALPDFVCCNARSYFLAILPDQTLPFCVTLLFEKPLRSSEFLSATNFAENPQPNEI